jgi:D-amino-acid dehydrogenase
MINSTEQTRIHNNRDVWNIPKGNVMKKNIAVIGAGISGVLAAYYLAKDGHTVTVYEQERYPAMRTSFANGGQVSVSNSEVWTTWSNVAKGIKWIFKKDAPLLIRPTFEWAKIRWMTKFMWNTITNKYARNTAETIRLGMRSRDLYKDIIAEEGLEFDQSFKGILHFYKDKGYFENAQSVKELYEDNGCQWDIVGNDKVRDIEPNLNTDGIIGGAWTKDDWTGDIHKFCIELSHVLKNKYGVKFRFGGKVHNIKNLDFYDAIVISNGVGSTALVKSIGDTIDVYPVKGYSITITANDVKSYEAMPKVSLLDDQAKIVTSTLGNRFRVAGTAELTGENYDIRRDRIEPLLNWVHTNFPDINTHDYSQWACLRPMTPDMMPIVQQSKNNPKVFYHTGHGHLGWTLSPATAVQLTKLIKDYR